MPDRIEGSLAPRPETNATSFGKLSSNGPFRPLGYQIKCPIPREAKSSPAFQEVRPEMVPLHSFCQILCPILCASAGDKLMAAKAEEATSRARRIVNREAVTQAGWTLDA